jgi:nitroreductase
MSVSSAKREPGNGNAFDATRDRAGRRYGLEHFAFPEQGNETLDLLFSHRSVRAYLPNQLPEGTLEVLVTAAQSASSSSNLQVWSVVAVEDKDRKARLAALANNQKHIIRAPLFLIWLLDLGRLDALAKERGLSAEGLDYIESFLVGAVDTSLAAQNAVVAAESLGLGTVYIGAIRHKPVDVAKELGLPAHVFPLFGLVVGHPDPAVPTNVKPRLPQPAVLFREHYVWDEAQRAAIVAYDATIKDFQQEQHMPVQAWSDQALNRVKDAPALHGRERLRDALTALGFGLK